MAPALKTGIFTLLLYLSNTTVAASIWTPAQALRALERRQSSCPAASPVSCSAVDPNLPSNWCCGANTACISIDSSSSALCCPNNGPCTAIEPINCDVSLQNANTGESGPIFTTRLSNNLPTCGNACCPFGYTCGARSDGTSFCQLDSSKAISAPAGSGTSSTSSTASSDPSSSSTSTDSSSSTSATTPSTSGSTSTPSTSTTSTSTGTISSSTGTTSLSTARTSSSPPKSSTSSGKTSSSATTTTTSTSTSSPTVRASGIDSSKPQAQMTSNPFPPGVFLAGFFPGIFLGAIGVLAWVVLTGRLRKQPPKSGADRPSMYGKRPEVSDPYENASTRRSDFVRRTKTIGQSAKTIFGKKEQPDGTPGLPFDSADEGWRNLTPPKNNDIPVNVLGTQYPAGPNAPPPLTPGFPQNMNQPSQGPGQPRGYGGFQEGPGYGAAGAAIGNPRTPDRNTMYTQTDDPTGEIIRIYTPPVVEKPAAAVAPLRGMNTRQRSRDSGWGEFGLDEQPKGGGRGPYAAVDDDKSVYAPSRYETLTPARYDGGGSQKRPKKATGGQRERPETTFTEMLRAINFPDPIRDSGNAPAMPTIPKEYQ